MRTGWAGTSCVWAAVMVASACGRSAPPSDVVARGGGRAITLAQVDAKWQEMNTGESLRALEAVYNGRRAALEALIGDDIIGRAAGKRGMSVPQFLSEELQKRARPVADADIEAFYTANKAQAQGRSLDEVRPAIADILKRQRRDEAREALLVELRTDAGVTPISLEPPRRTVEVSAQDPVRGPANAAVTIVEFSDYQCPFCARVTPTLAKIRATYCDRVRIVCKDFPLEEIHPRALDLAQGARCAGEQGKYWEFHDRVFANQAAVAAAPLADLARELSLKNEAFSACVTAKRFEPAIADGQFAGHALGVEATPTLFINGRMVAGAQPYDVIARVVDDELARQR